MELNGLVRLRSASRLVCGLLLVTLAPPAANGQGPRWTPQGPSPASEGQVENIAGGEVAGAIQAIAVHPNDSNKIWIGAVNGGIWRTDNALAPSPKWTPLSDDQPSLSIGALEVDPTDQNLATLVAGTGCFTNYWRCGRSAIGLLRTVDGGSNWAVLNGAGMLKGMDVTGVAPRGNTLVISVSRASSPTKVGIWRSTNTGASWSQVSSAVGSNLPAGPAADLAGRHDRPNLLFSVVGNRGVFRSVDTGATWLKVSTTVMDSRIIGALNAKVALGFGDSVFVAIVGNFGQLSGVFHSLDLGASWKEMDLPSTIEGGIHPGRGGGTNLSLVADPAVPSLVYIGGDRQPSGYDPFPDPNSIGATDYTGRLFRGDSSRPAGQQWGHLTHSRVLGAEGGGTENSSAPHADSRDLAFDANGELIEADDGGLFRRTNPGSDSGDWFSMNGDLQITEFHSVAWDRNAGIAMGGAQDTGTTQQRLRANIRWPSVSTSDGGVVAVADSSADGRSIRYSSYYSLIDFRREEYLLNVWQRTDNPALAPLVNSRKLQPQFYTPVVLNASDPNRLIFGGANSVFESFDRGETISEVGFGVVANATGGGAIAYGAASDPDVLYVGDNARFFARTGQSTAPLKFCPTYPGGIIVDIVLDPTRPQTAFVVDEDRVYRTKDAGNNWAQLSGNLLAQDPGRLRSVTYSSHGMGLLVLGTDDGVFAAAGPAFTQWNRLGLGLPRVPIDQLDFDPVDGTLLAGTLGRGAWTLDLGPVAPPSPVAPPEPQPPSAPSAVMPVISAFGLDSSDDEGLSAADPQAAVQLDPGIWIDPDASRAYFVQPSGGMEAVVLDSGATLWSTQAGGKPIGLAKGKLLGQLDKVGHSNKLQLLIFDAVTGKVVGSESVDGGLPADVKISVDDLPGSQFQAAIQEIGDNTLVSWEFTDRQIRGMHPRARPVMSLLPEMDPAVLGSAEIFPLRGMFKIDFDTGVVSNAGTNSASSEVLFAPKRVTALGSSSAAPIRQALSADERHVLVSQRTEGGEYQQTIYDRFNLARVGVLRTDSPILAFIVVGGRIIYESPMYLRQVALEAVVESRALKAVDLQTGTELWRRTIRDPAYRGPLPP